MLSLTERPNALRGVNVTVLRCIVTRVYGNTGLVDVMGVDDPTFIAKSIEFTSPWFDFETGSGIIFDSKPIEGTENTLYYALTNHHVVEEGGEMRIHFGDDKTDLAVRDYASYELYDIAVVRFVAPNTRVIRVHPISPIKDNTITQIMKGQDVYAIGTPEDITRFNYVTQGIVSLATYPYNGIEDLAIMHDAELNPGNSGGPLFNLNGDVIGINVAKVPSIILLFASSPNASVLIFEKYSLKSPSMFFSCPYLIPQYFARLVDASDVAIK